MSFTCSCAIMTEQNRSIESADSFENESDVEKVLNDSLQQLTMVTTTTLSSDSETDDKKTLHDLVQKFATALYSFEVQSDDGTETMNDLNNSLQHLATWMTRFPDQVTTARNLVANLMPLPPESVQLLINFDESLYRPGIDPVRKTLDDIRVLMQQNEEVLDRYRLAMKDFRSKREDVKYRQRRLLCAMIKQNVIEIFQIDKLFLKLDTEYHKKHLVRVLIEVSHQLGDSSKFRNVPGG